MSATLLQLPVAGRMEHIYRRVTWRLLPLLMACYAVAFLDRVNISYAQLQMKQALAFSDQVYAWGAGLFFVGYCLFELPSNLLLQKIGARRTLLRIMLCWGLVAAATALVTQPWQFYALRFLLGACEAGFYPGVLLYLTYWYPSARRARVIAIFAAAALAAGLLAGPSCGAILQYLHRSGGLDGWQWLLILQGLPAAALGLFAWFYLADRPAQAHWLAPHEQRLLEQQLEREGAGAAPQGRQTGIKALLRDPVLGMLALSNLLLMGAAYGLLFWAPTLLRGWGAQNHFELGLLAAIPNLVGIAGMVLIGRDSDRRRERRGHFIASTVLAAAGLGLVVAADGQLAWSVAGLSVAMVGIAAATPLFAAILIDYLPRQRAAAGIALVNSIGLLGGAFTPALSGRLLAAEGTAALLLLMVGLYLLAGFVLLLALRLDAGVVEEDDQADDGDNLAQN